MKTYENTAIKTGKHTVYLSFIDPIYAQNIPEKKNRLVIKLFPFITTNRDFVRPVMPLGI